MGTRVLLGRKFGGSKERDVTARPVSVPNEAVTKREGTGDEAVWPARSELRARAVMGRLWEYVHPAAGEW